MASASASSAPKSEAKAASLSLPVSPFQKRRRLRRMYQFESSSTTKPSSARAAPVRSCSAKRARASPTTLCVRETSQRSIAGRSASGGMARESGSKPSMRAYSRKKP